ncbi:hypothetical protein VE03_05066 [Pseudogymnoascus sp. 23342-1-I1]|nr:hypothetical protein VE03_05066 [Pseudogymnoascus sp. 23342-1-I1]
MASRFAQERVRFANSGFENDLIETTYLMMERVSEMVGNSDLEAFLLYKKETLALEEAMDPNPNHSYLREGLEKLERTIRANINSTNIDQGIDTGSRVPVNPATPSTVGTGPAATEVENAANVEAETSKKKRKKKKKDGQGVVIAEAPTDELSTMKTNFDGLGDDNCAGLEQAIRLESSLAKLQSGPDSTAAPSDMGDDIAMESLDKTDAMGDVKAPKKKGKKRRGKKKAQGGIDKGKRLAEIKNSAATGPPPSPHLPTDEAGAGHTCDHKQHSRCSHTTWKNDDTTFSKALAETIRELLLITPLDPKLRLELHVDMNKVKRRMDEVEAADGDASILRIKKQPSTASNKAPFSAFGKVITPELQRATSIHLLSTPKYYNGFLDYIEHLNYLVACGDEKAAAMADEADVVYSVLTAVYKEVSESTRSKVDAAAVKRDEWSLTESEIHEKRLAESAKKMRELQELEQGVRQPDDATETSKQSTSNPVPGQVANRSPSSTELESKVLSLLQQPAVLRRFISDYQAMRPNSDAYGSFWGQESHLIYQRLVDMRVAPDLGKQPSSQSSRKAPSGPQDATDARINSTLDEDEEAITVDDIIEFLVSETSTPEERQRMASYFAAYGEKLSEFLLARAEVEKRFNSSNEAKFRRGMDEAEKIYECILKEQSARELEASEELEAKLPAISNPSKTRDFVDRVMRTMVKQFAISPTGIRRFIWPLKFIAEHPSIHERIRAAALSEYEPFLQKAKNTPWHQPRFSTLIKLSAQEHVQLFMEAVDFMKRALESAHPRVLRHNANRKQSILPATKRAGLPIKAQIFHHIRDYESAYAAAPDDEGRASVNRDFCLPLLDCPRSFRETAKELHANAVEYAAFMEQKNNLANLPACFGDAEVRQTLVSSALLLVSALAELDPSPQSDRVRVMEVVAASSSYEISPPALGALAASRDAFTSYLAANEKVKTTFVREDIHHQAANGLSGCDESASSQEIGDHSKDHVPYFLGQWMPNAMAGDKAVAEQIPGKLSTAQEPAQPPQATATVKIPDALSHSQKMIKKRLVAENYRKTQMVPQSQHDIRAKARLILSDSSMLSSFFKSKEAMEYCSGNEDTPDEKFFLSEINRIYTEMKKMKADIDAGFGPQEPVSPMSYSMPPPAAQLSAQKEVEEALPKSSTPTPPQSTIKLSIHPGRQCVTVHHLQSRQGLTKSTPAPTPIIRRGRGVVYSPLGLPTQLTATLRPNAPPLPSDPELAKECIIFETARQRRKSLAAFYAGSHFNYEYFQEFRCEAEETVEGIVPTTEKGFRARKVLRALDDVDSMVQILRYGAILESGKGGAGNGSGHVQETAADLLSDIDERPGLMLILEALEQLFGDEPSSRQGPDAEPLVGLRFSQRLEELVVSAHYGLFIPQDDKVVGKMQKTAKWSQKIPHPLRVIDNATRPFTDTIIKRMPMFTGPMDVIRFAMDFYPTLAGLASSSIPLSSSGNDDTAKLSEVEIQKVLGGLDAMPVPPQVVADLYKSGAPAPKVPRFTDGDEAVAYMQSQIERVTALSRFDADSQPVADKYGVFFSAPNEYTVVPDSTPEGQALGKAMEDIQTSASKGDVPTDYQMAALGKARRELYASRLAKTSATADGPNKTACKPNPISLSVSTRAENRAAANLLARSETIPLVGSQYLPDAQPAARSPKSQPRQIIFAVGLPPPQPAPQPPQSPSAPISNKPDALLVPLRTAITEAPLFAPLTTMIGIEREIDNLFTSIDNSNEFQECRASLRLPDPASVESQALLGLNKVFTTYKAIRAVEERRLEELVDSAQEYQDNIDRATAEVRLWNQGLDAALETLEDYKLYSKRLMNAFVREMSALNEAHDDKLQNRRRRNRQSDRRGRGLGKKLGAPRKTTIEDFEVLESGDGPKLGSFRVG